MLTQKSVGALPCSIHFATNAFGRPHLLPAPVVATIGARNAVLERASPPTRLSPGEPAPGSGHEEWGRLWRSIQQFQHPHRVALAEHDALGPVHQFTRGRQHVAYCGAGQVRPLVCGDRRQEPLFVFGRPQLDPILTGCRLHGQRNLRVPDDSHGQCPHKSFASSSAFDPTQQGPYSGPR